MSTYTKLQILVATMSILAACNLKKIEDGSSDSCPNPPTANFTTDKTTGAAPLSVAFTNASTNASSYAWSFRDGSASSEASPSHTFVSAGNYDVFLIAQSSNGCRDTFTRTITVTGTPATPPVAQFSVSGGDCVAPCTVAFTNASTNAVTFNWNFGDGASSTENSPSHNYTTGGTFPVVLTVTGPSGATDDTTIVVTIRKGFKKILDLAPTALTLASSNQLASGNYHIMYYDNAYKSLILDKNGQTISSITPFSFDANWFFINGIPSNDGGFVLVGQNGSTGKSVTAAISNAQGVLWQQDFNFGNVVGTSSGFNLLQLANNETVICGYSNTSGNTSPGYGRISAVGNVINNIDINVAETQYLIARSIGRKTDGSFLVTCDGAGPRVGQAYLMSIDQSGAYQSVTPYSGISSISGLKSIGSGRFLMKTEGQGQYFLDMIDETGMLITYLQNTDTNIIEYDVASDGNIIILRKEDGIRLTKVRSDNMQPIWDQKITETGGTLEPRRLLKCADGGYFVSGTFVSNGQTDLYFLKTDANGDWQ